MTRSKRVQELDPMAYWKKHGKAKVEEVCAAAGTSYEYFKHIANRRKRPSVDLARRLVEHSGGELSLMELLPPIDTLR